MLRLIASDALGKLKLLPCIYVGAIAFDRCESDEIIQQRRRLRYNSVVLRTGAQKDAAVDRTETNDGENQKRLPGVSEDGVKWK